MNSYPLTLEHARQVSFTTRTQPVEAGNRRERRKAKKLARRKKEVKR